MAVWVLLLPYRPAQAQSARGPRTFVVDPLSSRVRVWLGRAGVFGFLGHDHLIEAPLADGRVEVIGGDLEQARVVLHFRAGALAIVPGTEPAGDIPKVEARMRGGEVLDVERHPAISVVSTTLAARARRPGVFDLDLHGHLELRGQKHDIAFPVTVQVSDETLRAHGEARLRLRDLGIEPPSVAGFVKVDNRFTVTFTINARSTQPGPAEGRDRRPGMGPGRRAPAYAGDAR